MSEAHAKVLAQVSAVSFGLELPLLCDDRNALDALALIYGRVNVDEHKFSTDVSSENVERMTTVTIERFVPIDDVSQFDAVTNAAVIDDCKLLGIYRYATINGVNTDTLPSWHTNLSERVKQLQKIIYSHIEHNYDILPILLSKLVFNSDDNVRTEHHQLFRTNMSKKNATMYEPMPLHIRSVAIRGGKCIFK